MLRETHQPESAEIRGEPHKGFWQGWWIKPHLDQLGGGGKEGDNLSSLGLFPPTASTGFRLMKCQLPQAFP